MSLDRLVADLGERIARLERGRAVAFTETGEAEFPGGIVVGTDPDEVVIGPQDHDNPTALVLTSGAFFDAVFIDADWTGSTSPDVVEYEITLVEEPAGANQAVAILRTVGTSVRFNGVKANTPYEVRVVALDRLGRPSNDPALTGTITSTLDATTPDVPAGVAAFAGLRSVTVLWSDNDDVDVRRGAGIYEVQLDTVATFDSPNLRTVRTSATITAFTDLVTGTEYFVRVSAIDSSGNQSGWSDPPVSATPGTTTGDDVGLGTLVSDHIVTAGLDAAVIKFGTMSGDRITANTLDVNALKTSTLTSRTITVGAGGLIQVGTATNGVLIDDAGLRLVQGGATKVTIPVSGSPTFEGTITATGGAISGNLSVEGILTLAGTGKLRTASSGSRLEISQSANDRINFWNGSTFAGRIGMYTNWYGAVSFNIEGVNGHKVRIPTGYFGTGDGGGGVVVTGTGEATTEILLQAENPAASVGTVYCDVVQLWGTPHALRVGSTDVLYAPGGGTVELRATGHALSLHAGEPANSPVSQSTLSEHLYLGSDNGIIFYLGNNAWTGHALVWELIEGSLNNLFARNAGVGVKWLRTLAIFQVRTTNDGTWGEIEAVVDNMSDSAGKREFAKLTDPWSVVLAAEPYRYELRTNRGRPVRRAGVVSNDLPKWMTAEDPNTGTRSIPVETSIGVLWAAVTDLHRRLEAMQGRTVTRPSVEQLKDRIRARLAGESHDYYPPEWVAEVPSGDDHDVRRIRAERVAAASAARRGPDDTLPVDDDPGATT